MAPAIGSSNIIPKIFKCQCKGTVHRYYLITDDMAPIRVN
jgi:hypothetical protein